MRFGTWTIVAVVVVSARVLLAEEAAPGNLAVNPGFEQPAAEGQLPEGWHAFSSLRVVSGISRAAAREGSQCLRMTAQGASNAYQMVVQTVPIEPCEKYTFTAWLLNDRADLLDGTARVQLVIDWKQDGTTVGRDEGPMEDKGVSRMRWQRSAVRKARAPKEASEAVIGIHLHDGAEGTGSVLVDDVRFERD
ncbi:MAG: hypothetical protein JXB04_04975 [Kiritimatiellae bacterium]|nr:hypothetical protein [Kiritimatiellia bacterium]